MKRNFPNFLDAYVEYADNKWAPRSFHLWAGVSLIAGALERKVWLPWDDTFSYYPNLFVFLVSNPGVGKSSALNKAVNLLQDLNKGYGGNLMFVPSQITEAKFIDVMTQAKAMECGTKIQYHSSGYYFASEASNSLKNIFGDFIACMTDFYDCPPFWEKATKKDGQVTLNNVCFNLLAGCTFDYLSKIITDDNIMGGFASRVTYVIYKDKLVREAKFQGGSAVEETAERARMRAALAQDLAQIHKLVGAFKGGPGFGDLFEKWYPEYEKMRQSLPSEKMQSLLVRKSTTIFKLCMILAAAEANDLTLRPQHWERAMAMTEEVEKELPMMLREAASRKTDTQTGLNQAIFREFVAPERVTMSGLKTKLLLNGFDPMKIESTIDKLLKHGAITQAASGLTLNTDPQAYL